LAPARCIALFWERFLEERPTESRAMRASGFKSSMRTALR
jgi:hypothetical protein